jgi:glucose/mannose-6-phosphate isomerase
MEPEINNLPNPQILDDLEEVKKIDVSNVLGSIQALANQVEDAWDQVNQLELAIDTSRIQNVVATGMGGSALGPDVIKRAFKNQLSVPLEVINDYKLPAYVGPNTLVLVSSYSGTTEETVAAMHEAHDKGAQILVISTGGQLAEFAKANNYGLYQINPTHNPSNQPRMAIGYSVFGIIAMFHKIGLLNLTDEQVNGVVATIRRLTSELDISVEQDKNQAKKLAFQIIGRIPVFIGSEHLEGALHVVQNQFNENAKTYAEYRIIPEMNHHLMEGLRFPQTNDANLFFVLFDSALYHERNRKRFQVTPQVIDGAGIELSSFLLTSTEPLEQVFEVITLGAFTNFYLAMLENIDPTPIETVDFFKAELSK